MQKQFDGLDDISKPQGIKEQSSNPAETKTWKYMLMPVLREIGMLTKRGIETPLDQDTVTSFHTQDAQSYGNPNYKLK
jgi:hypothetical protein